VFLKQRDFLNQLFQIELGIKSEFNLFAEVHKKLEITEKELETTKTSLTSTRIELSNTKSTVDDLTTKLNGKMTLF